MKPYRWLVIGILAFILVRVEHTGTQIDQLAPVETVMIKQEAGVVCVETDTGARGMGSDLEKAIANLHSSAPTKVFLDTARYLLITSKTENMLPQVYEILRPNTLVCTLRTEAELEEITRYLKTHPPKVRLRDIRAGKKKIQILYYQEGRGQLVE